MAYKPLDIDPNVPPRVRAFIDKRIEPLFRDVHAMLRLPVNQEGFETGCSMVAALTLFAMVAGLSRVFHFPRGLKKNKKPGGDRRRFIDFMRTKYLPFDRPRGKISHKKAAAIIYEEFRNNLVHALAEELTLDNHNRVIWSRGLQNEVKLLKAQNGLTEEQIAELENGRRLPGMKPTFDMRVSGTAAIHVGSLYLGLRTTVERLSRDQELMKKCAWILRKVPP